MSENKMTADAMSKSFCADLIELYREVTCEKQILEKEIPGTKVELSTVIELRKIQEMEKIEDRIFMIVEQLSIMNNLQKTRT
jgi:hypothetical protein